MSIKNKVSACLILKDEEKNLPALLKSIEGIADEIIAINRESTDRTREILQKAGAVIIERPDQYRTGVYTDEERGMLNSRAGGEWILHLDADERLTPDSRKALSELAQQKDYDVIWLFSRHFYAPGKWYKHGFYAPHREPRFYRRACKTNWNVRIHEAPKIEGRQFYSNLYYDHLYYVAGEERIKKKHEVYMKREREDKAEFLSKNPIIKWFFILTGYPAYFLYGFFWKLAFLDGWKGVTTNHFLARYFALSGYLEVHLKKRFGFIKYTPLRNTTSMHRIDPSEKNNI